MSDKTFNWMGIHGRVNSGGLAVHLSSALALVVLISGVDGFAQGFRRDVDRFNHFVQSSASSDGATRAFREGRGFISEKEWAKAEAKFREVLTLYPKSENVDVACYWLAFVCKKQAEFQEADRVLARMISQYPKSSWINDAMVMRSELAPHLGKTEVIAEGVDNNNDEIKGAALQSLFQADPDRAATVVIEMLKADSKASANLKDSALTLLGQYGGKQSTAVLIELARSSSEPRLRRKAITWLGWRDEDAAFAMLKDLTSSSDTEIAEAALSAIASSSNSIHVKRAGNFFSAVARTGRTLKMRQVAISALAMYGGDRGIDDLMAIYKSVNDIEIKKSIISAFGYGGGVVTYYTPDLYRGDPSATNTPRAATRTDVKVIDRESLTNGDRRERIVGILIQLFDIENNAELKVQVLSALGQSGQKPAMKKLMDIARSDPSQQLRMKSISYLGRSKDPEVLIFLEELLK